MINFTIRQVRNLDIGNLYHKLVSRSELSNSEKTALLKLSILFLNSTDEYTRKFGYRLMLKYCNLYSDYIPLYDISINLGFIPIAKFIESKQLIALHEKESFFREFNSSFLDIFKKDNIYFTEEQFQLNKFFNDANKKNIAIVAPTSYGKSELILSLIRSNPNANICIIVPTKSLLAQTKKRILKDPTYQLNRKIITHPEMYQEADNNIIAVLTQERLLRLLQKNNELAFDYAIIDEAHNLLESNPRSNLLASALIILNYRNDNTYFKYLTPFLLDTSNLTLNYTDFDITEYKVFENIKTENYYSCDLALDGIQKLYDQYLDKFFILESTKYENDLEYIFTQAGDKNIIYLNKPQDIESYAKRLLACCQPLNNPLLEKACDDISDYLHQDYLLVECLRRGFVYHHGSVPDNMRLFIEHLFTKFTELKYIITSSTLLEGVNIPADKLFILNLYKGISYLSPSQFKNLSGRVCRFSEIFNFNTGDLKKLEPEIHIIKDEYMSNNANIENYLSKTVKTDKRISETPKNVLLSNTAISETNITEKIETDEFIENQAPGVTDAEETRYAITDIGKACFKNNITEIHILNAENSMQNKVDKKLTLNNPIDDSLEAIQLIAELFIEYIEDNNDNRNIRRLLNPSAQNFYNMFLKWKMDQASYKLMINSFIRYWDKLIHDGGDTLIYVDKWGDTVRENPLTGIPSYRPLFTDISEKTLKEKINLAIVRIKDEQDFLDNNLIKFIDTLYDINLITDSLYYHIKYSTNNMQIITMIKNGIGFQTATMLYTDYLDYIDIDIENGTLVIHPNILHAMDNNDENEVVIFEVSTNIKE